jgi:ubiquitin-like 1-activating enzyme E1 A
MSMSAEQNSESTLNEAEAELYDRQLRLWGFEAQQRMQKSKILFCGIRGLFAEVIISNSYHL